MKMSTKNLIKRLYKEFLIILQIILVVNSFEN